MHVCNSSFRMNPDFFLTIEEHMYRTVYCTIGTVRYEKELGEYYEILNKEIEKTKVYRYSGNQQRCSNTIP